MKNGGVAAVFLTSTLVPYELHSSVSLPPEIEPQFSLDRRLDRAQSRSEYYRLEKNFLHLQ
jgi:hypothetical protein